MLTKKNLRQIECSKLHLLENALHFLIVYSKPCYSLVTFEQSFQLPCFLKPLLIQDLQVVKYQFKVNKDTKTTSMSFVLVSLLLTFKGYFSARQGI